MIYNNEKKEYQPYVYIVILNYNGWTDTIECLESVLKSKYDNYRIVIVDNASTNDSVDKIIHWMEGTLEYTLSVNDKLEKYVFPVQEKPIAYTHLYEIDFLKQNDKLEKVVLMQANENKGFSAGNNIGIKLALQQKECEYVWLLNNDTVIKQETLLYLHNTYKKYYEEGIKIGLLGSKLFYYDNPKTIQAIGGKFNKWTGLVKVIGMGETDNNQFENKNISIDYPVGASIFTSRKFIEDIGLMNESYFLYFEELDWSLRGLKEDWKTLYSSEGSLFHKQGASTKTGSKIKAKQKNLKIEYYKYRNLLLLYRLFFPKLIFIAYARLSMIALKKYSKGSFSEGNLIINTMKKNYEI